MTGYGTSSHIVLCEAITGTGTNVTYDNANDYTFIKAKEIDLEINFDSKVKNMAFGKSRLTKDLKYRQGFSVSNAILVGASDVNGTTEWIMDAYIAKTLIYAVVELPPATGSTYAKKSWYDNNQSKVYYLKGVLEKLRMKVTNGRLIKISCNFKECWT